MTPFPVRLRRLLDVLQGIHGIKRSVAERIVGGELGLSPKAISNYATGGYRHQTDTPMRYHAGLRALEVKHKAPLRALIALEGACARAAA